MYMPFFNESIVSNLVYISQLVPEMNGFQYCLFSYHLALKDEWLFIWTNKEFFQMFFRYFTI